MKHIKLFENHYKKDTRTITLPKKNAKEVSDYFFRHGEIYNADVQFIDFDEVEIFIYDTDDMTQEDIDNRLDEIEDVCASF